MKSSSSRFYTKCNVERESHIHRGHVPLIMSPKDENEIWWDFLSVGVVTELDFSDVSRLASRRRSLPNQQSTIRRPHYPRENTSVVNCLSSGYIHICRFTPKWHWEARNGPSRPESIECSHSKRQLVRIGEKRRTRQLVPNKNPKLRLSL